MIKFTKTNNKVEIGGADAEYDDGLGNMLHMKIARSSNNPNYEATVSRLMEPYQRKKNKKEVSNEQAKKVMCKAMAEDILLGWDAADLVDETGEQIVYSKENAYELLYNDTDLRDFVGDFADNINNYIQAEAIAGK